MKKRILACIVFMAVLCMPFPSFAEETELPITGSCGQYLRYEYYQSTKTLTIIGNGNMPNYPADKYEGSIAPWRNNSNIDNFLEKVVISDGVTTIGDNAFFACDNLISVTIPNSVTSIGETAFYGCTDLESVIIPDGTTDSGDAALQRSNLTSIEKDAFLNCTGLTSITVFDMTADGDSAFSERSSLVNIGEGAFNNCNGLTSVAIPDGVKSIGDHTFKFCSSLTSITLPDSLTSIGDGAFEATAYYNEWSANSEQCNVLYIGNHLIKADEWELNNNMSNNVISSDYVVKPGTKSIAACAFYYCNELTSITLPDSMAGIGNRAFEFCSSLKSITIPSDVTSIGDSVFNICPDLTGISVAEDNPAYCSVNGVLYNKDKTALIRFPQGKQDTRFTIPNGVTSISVGAFAGCSSLTSVTIPNGVTSIGSEAFSTCSALTSITIPDGVTTIDQKTFYACSSLTDITIPNSVLIIGENAFEGCRSSMKVYYTGSEADWGEVIGDGKSVLQDTNIYYCKGITATRNDDGTIEVSPNKIDSGTVILALYGGDKGDKLIEMQSEKYSGTKITFTATQAYTRAKIMIWNSLGGMSPECGIKNVR